MSESIGLPICKSEFNANLLGKGRNWAREVSDHHLRCCSILVNPPIHSHTSLLCCAFVCFVSGSSTYSSHLFSVCMNHRRGIFCEGVAGSKPKASTWNDAGSILDVLVPALRSDQEAEATLFGLHEPAPQLAFLLLNIYVYYIYIYVEMFV